MAYETDKFSYTEDLGVICVYPDDFVYPEDTIIDVGGCIIEELLKISFYLDYGVGEISG